MPYRATLMTSNGVGDKPIGAYARQLADAKVFRVIVNFNDLFWGSGPGSEFTDNAHELRARGVTLIPAIWCFDPLTDAKGFRPDGSPGELCRLSNDEIRQRLVDFFGKCVNVGRNGLLREICWDSELYYATPGMNGGVMQKDRAWVSSPDVDVRANEFGQLHKVNDCLISTCVTTRHALELGAWTAWWRGAMKNVPLGKVYAEDSYLRGAIDPANFGSQTFDRVRFILTTPRSMVAVVPGYWPSTRSWRHFGDEQFRKDSKKKFEADLDLFGNRLAIFARSAYMRSGSVSPEKVLQRAIRQVWYYDQDGEILEKLGALSQVHAKLGATE